MLQEKVTTPTFTAFGAAQLAALIRSGQASSADVVEAHIRRIEEINGSLNAVVVPLFEEARRAARTADARQARGEPLGPLHGVPITIKEEFEVRGTPATWGLLSRAGRPATDEGPLVRRLRDAGAIILGKTNVPQLLIYHEADNPVYGRSHNPWSARRTPGGSSGGEGAIIAAGGSPLGLGSDIGGSIRVPAHFCGIHGLKPTSGRLTRRDSPPDLAGEGQDTIISQPGPLARRVEDLALALSVLAAPGLDRLDATVPPVPWTAPESVSLQGLRIGYYVDDGYFPAAPALRRAVKEALPALEARGAAVEPFAPPDVPEAIAMFYGILSADGGASARRTLGANPRDRRIQGLLQLAGIPRRLRRSTIRAARLLGQPRMAALVASVGALTADQYWQLVHRCAVYRRHFVDILDAAGFDALICPPHALPALTHGASYYLSTAASYSMLFNLLGWPAGVVAATRVRPGEESDRPFSRDIVERSARLVEAGSAGLPVGIQVAARPWREDIVLAIMAAIEEHFRTTPDYPTLV